MRVSSVSQKYNVTNFGINLNIPRASRLLLHKSGANNDSINVFIKYAKTLEPKNLNLTLSRGRKAILFDSELPAYDFLKFVTDTPLLIPVGRRLKEYQFETYRTLNQRKMDFLKAQLERISTAWSDAKLNNKGQYVAGSQDKTIEISRHYWNS